MTTTPELKRLAEAALHANGALASTQDMADADHAFVEAMTPAVALSLIEENERMREAAEGLSAAISWLDYPFIDNNTSEDELRSRVGFMMKDAEKHRAVINPKASHD